MPQVEFQPGFCVWGSLSFPYLPLLLGDLGVVSFERCKKCMAVTGGEVCMDPGWGGGGLPWRYFFALVSCKWPGAGWGQVCGIQDSEDLQDRIRLSLKIGFHFL